MDTEAQQATEIRFVGEAESNREWWGLWQTSAQWSAWPALCSLAPGSHRDGLVPTCSESLRGWLREEDPCWVKYQKPALQRCLVLPLFAWATTSGSLMPSSVMRGLGCSAPKDLQLLELHKKKGGSVGWLLRPSACQLLCVGYLLWVYFSYSQARKHAPLERLRVKWLEITRWTSP